MQATRRARNPTAEQFGLLGSKALWLAPATGFEYPARLEVFEGFDPVELVVTLALPDYLSFLDEIDAPRSSEIRSVDRVFGMQLVIRAQYDETAQGTT